MSGFSAIASSFGLGAADDIVSPATRNGHTPESVSSIKKRKATASSKSPAKKKSLSSAGVALKQPKAKKNVGVKRKREEQHVPAAAAAAAAATNGVKSKFAKAAAKPRANNDSLAAAAIARVHKIMAKTSSGKPAPPVRAGSTSAPPSMRVSKYRMKKLATRASVPRISDDAKTLAIQLHQALVGLYTRHGAAIQLLTSLKSRTLSKSAVKYAIENVPVAVKSRVYGV